MQSNRELAVEEQLQKTQRDIDSMNRQFDRTIKSLREVEKIINEILCNQPSNS